MKKIVLILLLVIVSFSSCTTYIESAPKEEEGLVISRKHIPYSRRLVYEYGYKSNGNYGMRPRTKVTHERHYIKFQRPNGEKFQLDRQDLFNRYVAGDKVIIVYVDLIDEEDGKVKDWRFKKIKELKDKTEW